MTTTLKGYEAIEYAEANGLLLSKYEDPTEDAREGLTPDEARRIASEDPSLIWAEVDLAVGDQVEGGETDEDRDTGRVIGIADGEEARVAWSSGVRTTQPISMLRKAGGKL